jgi:hypothetical protein
MAARLLADLGRFFRDPLTAEACRVRLVRSLAERDTRFLALLGRGVYERRDSPYLPLLLRAGVAYGDVARLVGEVGVEGALERLYDAGVHVTLDEFKGRVPIRRPGLDVPTAGSGFDNPFLTAHYESRSSGSRGQGARLVVDLDLVEHEACYDRQFFDDFHLMGRPKLLWRMAPPGASGLKMVLRLARLGGRYDRWYSQAPPGFKADPKHAVFIRAIAAAARWHGRALPMPEHLPVSDAVTVARWLADRRAAGTPAYLSTTASCAVRVCAAAAAHGLDIRDTFICAGGEPLSPGKVKVIAASGCVVRTNYAMAEVGRMAMACGRPSADDDVHLMTDKLAVVQRATGRDRVPALWLTTLHWSTPKIMLNVEIGDTGVLERRRCGCTWDALGFPWHLTTIRSYEKLTTEGMHFVGADLIALVEDILPARFGGSATDYQLVEAEEDGLTRVSLLVSPRLGPLDEAAIRTVALEALGAAGTANRMMAGVWRDSDTLRVVRREPHATRTGKIQTLHAAGPMAGVR